nr:immunoglobulin light chain junction region [Macaca mulatta]
CQRHSGWPQLTF